MTAPVVAVTAAVFALQGADAFPVSAAAWLEASVAIVSNVKLKAVTGIKKTALFMDYSPLIIARRDIRHDGRLDLGKLSGYPGKNKLSAGRQNVWTIHRFAA
jgi:hypothetical protein